MWNCELSNGMGFWPMGPMIGGRIFIGLLAVAGFVFSIWMLVDCLKRSEKDFKYPISQGGRYDKLIWSIAIIVTGLWFFFIGAIVYYFVVKREDVSSQSGEGGQSGGPSQMA